MEQRRLGASELDVSRISLGSWRTYERMPRDAGLAVMRAARDAGINFLDDARYDDETGSAPIPTGYSEVIFGELFRAAGWRRDDTVVANKLWWEFWPDEQIAQLARALHTTPAALAIAFALANPSVATALMGATSPDQLRQNVAALDLDPAAVLGALRPAFRT